MFSFPAGPSTLPAELQLPVAKRQFTDERGVEWLVWDVHPGDVGRMIYDRRAAQRDESAGEAVPSARLVQPELQQGWLCFLAETEKRRFTPIPPDWDQLPDSVLRVMLEVASPAPQSDARISSRLASD
jgi:hypothetical protein